MEQVPINIRKVYPYTNMYIEFLIFLLYKRSILNCQKLIYILNVQTKSIKY